MKIGMIVAIVDEMKQLLNEYGSEMTEIKKEWIHSLQVQSEGT